jgi:hypothetical protein
MSKESGDAAARPGPPLAARVEPAKAAVSSTAGVPIAFERVVRVRPAYDHLASGGGIGACSVLFLLKGPHGAVDFSLYTGWHLPSALEHLQRFPAHGHGRYAPMGVQVAYHARTPQYEDHGVCQQSCEWLDGAPCYSDGSFIQGSEWMAKLIERGTDWLWPALEQEYRERFFARGIEGQP